MEPLMGEIKMFAGNFAPNGWFTCEGQRLSINQYTALFSILGTTYGGDGVTYFQLPDMRGSFPTQCSNISGSHIGGTYSLGQVGGNLQVTLNAQQMPAHTHTLQAVAAAANQATPEGNYLSIHVDGVTGNPDSLYNDFSDKTLPIVNLNTASALPAGSSQPVNITPPFLAMQFIIAWSGIYPSRP